MDNKKTIKMTIDPHDGYEHQRTFDIDQELTGKDEYGFERTFTIRDIIGEVESWELHKENGEWYVLSPKRQKELENGKRK